MTLILVPAESYVKRATKMSTFVRRFFGVEPRPGGGEFRQTMTDALEALQLVIAIMLRQQYNVIGYFLFFNQHIATIEP